MQVVVAEKPAVARDIAQVLGASRKAEGYLHGQGYFVTWALGHLVSLPQPHEVNAAWRRWDLSALPMLPEAWPLSVLARTRKQYQVIASLLRRKEVTGVICATDAGREGELIFRQIMERAKCRKPVKRLWISSLTDSAIRAGLAQLRDGAEYDALAAAASGRSRADWLVGMNLSRAYSLAAAESWSVGRVQTPTLAMVVERERAIRDFVPEDYSEVWAKLLPEGAEPKLTFEARLMDSGPSEKGDVSRRHAKEEQQPADARGGTALPGRTPGRTPTVRRFAPGDPAIGRLLDSLVDRLGGQRLEVTVVKTGARSIPPPLLYDLTELQRHANRVFGFSASRTLEIAQTLYERHKVISYPRTDCRHLSSEVAQGIPAVVAQLAAQYAPAFPAPTGVRALGRRYIDDRKVTDHHAIIPTTTVARLPPGSPEAKLYDLVVRRLLAAHMADYRYTDTVAWFRHRCAGDDYHFRAQGKVILDEGYRAMEYRTKRQVVGGDREPPQLPPLTAGMQVPVVDAGEEKKRTAPPPHLTDATLLTAMETAGKTVDDKTLSEAMRARGLGTPATRAATIETLLDRGYIEREAKQLRATASGEQLVDAVHAHVRSPIMTGEWEFELRQIESGQAQLEPFLKKIEAYVTEVVGVVRSEAPEHPQRGSGRAAGKFFSRPARASKARRGGKKRRAGSTVAAGEVVAHERAPRAKGRARKHEKAAKRAAPRRGTAITASGTGAGRAAKRPAVSAEQPGPPMGHGRTGRAPQLPGTVTTTGRTQAAARAPSTATGAGSKPAKSSLTPTVTPSVGGAVAAGGGGLFAGLPSRPRIVHGIAGLLPTLKSVYGEDGLRATEKRACEHVVSGEPALLIGRPSTARAHCYQLPALCRGGTTLVVTPLSVSLEDEVARLQRLGVRAERIHGGRGRMHSRAVCRAYLDGELDFLFISPDPFAVQGFTRMLSRRLLSLVVVDDAHMLSRRDPAFRADYGQLPQCLNEIPAAPRVALTASQNQSVHDEIQAALGPRQLLPLPL